MKTCSNCKQVLPQSDFYADKRNRDGKQSNCKYCCRKHAKNWRERNLERAKATSRKSAAAWAENNRKVATERAVAWNKDNPQKRSSISKRNKLKRARRTVAWADNTKIDAVYYFRDFLDCLTLGLIGYDVDHIIPLNGKTVCGLHVHENLTVCRSEYNRKKSNKFPIGGLDI